MGPCSILQQCSSSLNSTIIPNLGITSTTITQDKMPVHHDIQNRLYSQLSNTKKQTPVSAGKQSPFPPLVAIDWQRRAIVQKKNEALYKYDSNTKEKKKEKEKEEQTVGD